jgi:PKD repeat protein
LYQLNSNSIEVSVSDSPVPTITTSGITSICDGESLTLTASASDSYVWNLNGEALEGETSQTISATEEGAYTVTVTNADQCDGTGTSNFVFVQVNPTPTANFEFDFDFGSTTYEFNNTSTLATSYTWEFGDGNTSTSTNPTHTYATGGDYTVTLTATNGSCSDVYTFTLNSVGVDEDFSINQISVYPNPVSGDATVAISTINHKAVEVAILDLTGKQIWNSGKFEVNGVQQMSIPTSAYQSGIYFVQISADSTRETVRLIVKN